MSTTLAFLGDYLLGKVMDSAMHFVRSPDFDDARRRADAEAAFEVDLAWQRQFQSLSDEVKARLAETVTEREVVGIFVKLLPATVEATTHDRMTMLAGVWTPDLTAEMRSRVSRAVLDLEPSDILVLRGTVAAAAQAMNHIQMDAAYEGLMKAGCIAPIMQMSHVGITALGRAVLVALQAWSPGD